MPVIPAFSEEGGEKGAEAKADDQMGRRAQVFASDVFVRNAENEGDVRSGEWSEREQKGKEGREHTV